MSLNIKNAETERLARQLAASTGESVTQAVQVAVRERLDRVKHDDASDVERRKAQILALGKEAAKRWPKECQPDHGDLLYDEAGLPN